MPIHLLLRSRSEDQRIGRRWLDSPKHVPLGHGAQGARKMRLLGVGRVEFCFADESATSRVEGSVRSSAGGLSTVPRESGIRSAKSGPRPGRGTKSVAPCQDSRISALTRARTPIRLLNGSSRRPTAGSGADPGESDALLLRREFVGSFPRPSRREEQSLRDPPFLPAPLARRPRLIDALWGTGHSPGRHATRRFSAAVGPFRPPTSANRCAFVRGSKRRHRGPWSAAADGRGGEYSNAPARF